MFENNVQLQDTYFILEWVFINVLVPEILGCQNYLLYFCYLLTLLLLDASARHLPRLPYRALGFPESNLVCSQNIFF